MDRDDLIRLAEDADQRYRPGRLQKRDGSFRPISEPSPGLKSVQQRLLKRVLKTHLPLDGQVDYSGQGRGSVRAALQHQGAEWVGCVDIRDFFGSVSSGRVYQTLVDAGFPPDSARLITRLATRAGSLPQGAPTSPWISSATLHCLDAALAKAASEQALVITRYVDDIVISGSRRQGVQKTTRIVIGQLRALSLAPARSKVRVSQGCRARVHGLAISPRLRVTRAFWRKLRSARRRVSVLGEADDGSIRGMEAYQRHVEKLSRLHDATRGRPCPS